ncbi:MAG TPA: hypothetical protein VF483_12630 [Gemmatimonadaceae bacterium]
MPPAPILSRKPERQVFRLTDEILAALRQRVDSKYYDRPEVIEVIARAILCSHYVYLS